MDAHLPALLQPHQVPPPSSTPRLETAYAAATPGAMAAVVERSLYSERYCFVQSMAEGGLLSPGEFAILDNTFNMLTGRADPALHIDLIVYIESEPEVLLTTRPCPGADEEGAGEGQGGGAGPHQGVPAGGARQAPGHHLPPLHLARPG